MEPLEPHDWTKELSEDLIPHVREGGDEDVDTPPEVEKWVEDTKGVERIVSVAITTSKPRTAEWIGKQAVVSEQTARDHLKTFADLGVIKSFTSSGVTRYHADDAFIHYREVSRCAEQYSKEELSDKIEEFQSMLREIKEKYEVRTPDELRALAADDETDIDTIRDAKKTASEWETLRDRLDVFEDAIRRFDKFQRPATARV